MARFEFTGSQSAPACGKLWTWQDQPRKTRLDEKQKAQRKSDKERAAGARRDPDDIGKPIDSTEIRNPKEDFGQSAARIEREASAG